MIKIAHRGNTRGPNPELENKPEYIFEAIQDGFEVEIDIWFQDGDGFYLGHDYPKYKIDEEFIPLVIPHAWFHCKDLLSLEKFINDYSHARFFWHQEDSFTLTSSKHIWTYPGKEIVSNTILVHLEEFNEDDFETKPFAICSDFLV
jgi:hypothetical protein